MSEPCFNILRTQKQLGYNCWMQMHDTAGTLGFSVTVQSSHIDFNPKVVEDEIEAFMNSSVKHLAEMQLTDFEDQISALIDIKMAPFPSLKSEAKYYWSEIISRNARMFDRRDKEVEYLQTISQNEMVDFAKTLLQEPRKISFHVVDPEYTSGAFKRKCDEEALVLCTSKPYDTNNYGRRFVSDWDEFKGSVTYNPHVDI